MEQKTKWLTVNEAAEYMGITKTCLYQWRARNRGPRYFKLQNQLRYRIEDLDEFLRRCERPCGMGEAKVVSRNSWAPEEAE